MKTLRITATAITWTLAAAAYAGETAGTGIGARQSTTAEVHCDALSGPKRESCLRALHEPDRSSRDPAASVRSQKESAQPPVKAAPAASRTPVEASQRAADPKAPSGALIIDTPSGKLP